MWDQITIGGIVLRETVDIEGDGNRFTIAGQESSPPSEKEYVRSAHHNILALRDRIVPVVFGDKSEHTGFFEVTGAASTFTDAHNGRHLVTDWRLTLDRIGTARDVEFESRFVMIPRSDDLAGVQTASFWHAPAPSVSGYFTGADVPNSVVRTSDEGDVTVFFGLPTDVPPRWTAPAENFETGSARVVIDGVRRLGTVTIPGETWEVSNGIIRVAPSGGNLDVSTWLGVDGWSTAKRYAVSVNGSALAGSPEFTILKNEPEQVVVRLTYPVSAGRLTVDLSLRRGARFVTGVVKRHSAGNLGIARTSAETANTFTGGLVASAADAEGVRFVMGSTRAPSSTAIGTASMVRNSVSSYDFFLGAVPAVPASGDSHLDLFAQYLGTTGDRTRVMPR